MFTIFTKHNVVRVVEVTVCWRHPLRAGTRAPPEALWALWAQAGSSWPSICGYMQYKCICMCVYKHTIYMYIYIYIYI